MTHAELYEVCLSRIDRDGMRRIQKANPNCTWSKFFDVEAFLAPACAHALRFELKPGSNCIDVGCGFGYTALALERLGHNCVAWDNVSPILQQVSECVPVKNWNFKTITRNDGAELLGNYDLIYLHGVWPLRDAGGWWGGHDYASFARSLLAGLNDGGVLEIICNRGDQEPVMLGAAIPGARISDNVITVRREAALCAAS